MADENQSSAEDKAGTGQDTGASESGNSENAQHENTEAPNFKYKTQAEAEKAYAELEKKFGEHSKEVEEARKLKEQTDTLLRAIWSDPDLYRQVESGVKKYTSGESISSADIPKSHEKNGDDGAKNEKNGQDHQVQDLRIAEENRVLGDFFTKYGYNSLTEKDRKESYQRLVVSLAEIFDPGGKKPIKEILSEIPLSKLPRYLEHAHFIANKDQLFEKAKRSALVSREENDAATIGSFSSGSPDRSEQVTLTQKERETAQKLGISEDKYLKRKAETAKEASRYNR